MTADAKTILEKLRNRVNTVTIDIDITAQYKNPPDMLPSRASALEVIKRIKTRASGVVSQTSKTTFSFYRDKRPDIIEWLKEKQVQHNTDYNSMVIHFEDIELAMEFKLIFC